ncbi:MAG: NHL repeat-containing protein [Armatimonadota bacterium]
MDDRQRIIELWAKIAGAAVAFVACAVLVVMSVQGARQRAELTRQSRENVIASAIDPSLIHYREVRRIETGMREARGIAVRQKGVLFVVGDRSLQRYGADGVRQKTMPLSGKPTCVATGADGRVAVGYADHLWLTDPVGGWKLPAKVCLTSIAVGEQEVWAADASNKVIYRYDFTGKLRGRIGEKLIVPTPHLDVAAAKDGSVWVANPGRHRLERYARDGRLLSSWGKAGMAVEGFSGCCNPAAFALLPDGRIVTAEKGLRRVKIYRTDGAFDGVVAGPASFNESSEALDVATDAAGRVYILDPVDGIVRVFENSGTP